MPAHPKNVKGCCMNFCKWYYYLKRLGYYELMGIRKYWILGYFGLGGGRFIGDAKIPTISVYTMVDGEYEVKQFHDDKIIDFLVKNFESVFPV